MDMWPQTLLYYTKNKLYYLTNLDHHAIFLCPSGNYVTLFLEASEQFNILLLCCMFVCLFVFILLLNTHVTEGNLGKLPSFVSLLYLCACVRERERSKHSFGALSHDICLPEELYYPHTKKPQSRFKSGYIGKKRQLASLCFLVCKAWWSVDHNKPKLN